MDVLCVGGVGVLLVGGKSIRENCHKPLIFFFALPHSYYKAAARAYARA